MSINSSYNNPIPIDGKFTSTIPTFGVDGKFNSSQKGNFDALGAALQSGDLSGAQAAFAKIQAGRKHHGHHAGGAKDSDGDGDKGQEGTRKSQFGADFKALASALSSNNLTAAQSAWTQLLNDRQGAGASNSPTLQPTQNPAEAFVSTDPGLNVTA